MNKQTRNLIIFFVATFIWTWAFYIPIAAGGHSPYEMPWMIFFILGGMGPSVIGIALVLLTCDKEQRCDYWRRCFSFKRIRVAWWIVILLVFPVIAVLSIAIEALLGGSVPGLELLKSLIANPVTIPLTVFLSFMSGPWSEEFGWRGFALDRIIKPLGIIPGSVTLGFIWGVWHLPLFFMPATWHGQIGFGLSGFWMFILLNIGLSLIMIWVYLNTEHSILSAMMLHFTSNFTAQLIEPASSRYLTIRVLLMLVIGFLVILCMMNQNRKMRNSNVEVQR